jgi:RimJ/RimL family protein N-acetyltransferase
MSEPGDCPAFAQLLNDVGAEGEWVIAGPGEGSVIGETVSLAALLGSGGMSLSLDVGGAVAGRVMVQRGHTTAEHHAGELAVVVARAYRNEGMGAALVDAAVDWCGTAGVTRIALRVFTTNLRAIAVYRAAGFTEEGVLRRAVRVAGGDRDLAVMSRLL